MKRNDRHIHWHSVGWFLLVAVLIPPAFLCVVWLLVQLAQSVARGLT